MVRVTAPGAAARAIVSLVDPPEPADRRRTPHRETVLPAGREAHHRGPGPRSHTRLAVLTGDPQHLPRPPGTRQGTRDRGDRFVPELPILEVARLGRTVKQWKAAILAYFDTNGASNGPTEANNGVI